jgi:hypothetical protein
MAQETGSDYIINKPFVKTKQEKTLDCPSRLIANAKIPSPFKVSIHPTTFPFFP